MNSRYRTNANVCDAWVLLITIACGSELVPAVPLEFLAQWLGFKGKWQVAILINMCRRHREACLDPLLSRRIPDDIDIITGNAKRVEGFPMVRGLESGCVTGIEELVLSPTNQWIVRYCNEYL